MSAGRGKYAWCAWFALCENKAVRMRLHPTLGSVPICQRCDDKVDYWEMQNRREGGKDEDPLAVGSVGTRGAVGYRVLAEHHQHRQGVAMKTTHKMVIQAAAGYGLQCDISSPGDGMSRYRFWKERQGANPSASSPTLKGAAQARIWLDGYGEGLGRPGGAQ